MTTEFTLVGNVNVYDIIDQYDKLNTTCNYLLKSDNVPVATVRFIKIDNETVKLQRLVVPNKYRGNGYGKYLFKFS